VRVDSRGRTLHAATALGRVNAALDRGRIADVGLSEAPDLCVAVVDNKLAGGGRGSRGWPQKADCCHVARMDNMNAALRAFGEEPRIIDERLKLFLGIGPDRAFSLACPEYTARRQQEGRAALTDWSLAETVRRADEGHNERGVWASSNWGGTNYTPQQALARWIGANTASGPDTLLLFLSQRGQAVW